MGRRSRTVAATATLAIALPMGVAFGAAPAYAAGEVEIDPSVEGTPFGGWGTSLAWSANYTGDWSNREELADLLFANDLNSPSLGLNIARYNIGGGDAPEFAGTLRPGAEVPGYRSGPDEQYNWEADPRQRWWLDAAKARVPADDFIVDAIAYSAPYWMTQSGRSIGNTDGSQDNLLSGYEDEFANYLADVTEHFAEQGTEFRVLSPLNEPSTNYWSTAGRQEGMHVSPGANQAALLDATYEALAARGLSTGLSAVDETSIDLSISDLRALQAAGFDMSRVDQINAHTYSGGDRDALHQMAVGSGEKRLQMSEVTIPGGSFNPQAISASLSFASALTTDLKQLRPDEWVYWQALESEAESIAGDGNWGLVHYTSDGSEEYSITRKFHAFRQYTNFIRPGSTFLWNSGSSTVSALNEDRDELTIVTFNNGSSPQAASFDLGKFAAVGAEARVFRTSATEDRAEVAAAPVAGDTLDVSLPARSISTFVVPVEMPAIPEVANGTFELGDPGQEIPGWLTRGGDTYGSQITADYTQRGGISGGELELVHYGTDPYTVTTYQDLRVAPGMYTVRAEARSNGGTDVAQLVASSGESRATAPVPNDEAFSGIAAENVEVLDGTLRIELETRSPGNRWVAFDNVTIERQVSPAATLAASAVGDATEGSTVQIAATATDRYGQSLGDVSDSVEVTSDNATDRVDGASVTLGEPGTRTLTVTLPGSDATAAVEVDVIAAPEESSLDVTAEAATRCAAGKVQVTVKVTNNDDVAVQVAAVSEYGTKTFASVAPGKSATHAYTTRATNIAGGEVDVTASATVDGQPVSTLMSAPYDSRTCG
ncbi:glycoside hydrolase [Microbacterium sp. ET2]|uniref:glycoside hydrolase n=1 Tax=Microbacterium albipurpureum TaxID=3050384 RepID=UPI00259D1AC7|nr:glycoside hydrolase [Microbacterium sp. ET2 (Ac-2212)]WJL96978.1 glycoside hydrolase [Microbacterium sp. ET2 (Ac-2212)]